MSYRIIAAMCKNLGIGYQGGIPWTIKSDMRQFSKLTKGNGNNAVVMGRGTWDSLACIPLKGRDNIVMSRSPWKVTSNHLTAGVVTSIPVLINLCKRKAYEEVWIIGGANIYRQFLETSICDVCYLTYIHKEYHCDTFFPFDKCNMNWLTESTRTLSENNGVRADLHIMKPTDILVTTVALKKS